MNEPKDFPDTQENIEIVLEAHREALMSKPNVVGVGIGYRETHGVRTETVCIVVFVSQKLPREQLSAGAVLPSELEGIPIDVQEIGKISAQS